MRPLNLVTTIVLVLLSFSSAALALERPKGGKRGKTKDCYVYLQKVKSEKFAVEHGGSDAEKIHSMAGTKIPIVRAFEKEGLWYEDIAAWFPTAKPETGDKLRARLKAELAGKKPKHLLRWLKKYSEKYRAQGVPMPPKKWAALDVNGQLAFLLESGDPFSLISVKGRSELFFDEVLSFDDLAVSDATPPGITVSSDLGSYEIKTASGIDDLAKYLQLRQKTEEFMEGRVGHQHLVHGWPQKAEIRKAIAPYYIELLDSVTWYLFYRQLKRDPDDVASILDHPFLGVYTRDSLLRLFDAVVDGDVSRFKNKFRMVGARALKSDESIEGQRISGGLVPDFELRSGNKGEARELVEAVIESRLISGNYSGLRDFRSYEFDPSAPISKICERWLTKDQIKILEKFEKKFPMMKYSDHALAHNHFRNKIIAPLLPWENRLVLGEKTEILNAGQKRYAIKLALIAQAYLDGLKTIRDQVQLSELREETMEKIQKAGYRFSAIARLDVDFERYLIPAPTGLPDVTIVHFDVNRIDLGIEYSFRFPHVVRNKDETERYIKSAVENFSEKMGGGKIERLDEAGHGHGLSIRYRFTDNQNRVWRFEWDGIQREYLEGEPVDPWGGHMEVPTPKFAPATAGEIQRLYQSAREAGLVPKRTAGGSHVNIDLADFMALPPMVGARKMADLISFFEANREIVSFIWQSPVRQRVAIPVERTPEMELAFNEFKGDWNDLALLLYTKQYFNPYVGRKPRYIQFNVTSLITPVAPDAYVGKSIDIKNPEQKWFPEFGTGLGRVEFRLFDAMTDAYQAALQLKYVRALLDYALNKAPRSQLVMKSRFTPQDVEFWSKDAREFMNAANEHFEMLGLDPSEYRQLAVEGWLMRTAWENRQLPPLSRRKKIDPPVKYKKFLPPKNLEKSGRHDIPEFNPALWCKFDSGGTPSCRATRYIRFAFSNISPSCF